MLALLPDGAVEGSPAELKRSTDPRVMNFLDEDLQGGEVADTEVEVMPGGDDSP